MAAYNGAAFIEEQLRSILSELLTVDEVVVVDDKSTDNTLDIVESIGDSRIRVLRNTQNLGYVRTFERALREAEGDVLFLSDQDDIWLPGRVDAMLAAMGPHLMVVSNCEHIGDGGGRFHDIRLKARDSTHHARNILGILVGYRLHWGCAMAMRRELLPVVVPFPTFVRESHDQYLAMAANVAGSIEYMEQDTILHRLHGSNLTPSGLRSVGKIFRARADFFRELLVLRRRVRRAAPKRLVRLPLPSAGRSVGVVVTCYEPPTDIVDRVQGWVKDVGPVVAVDDGSVKADPSIWDLLSEAGATVVRLGANTGIANALNVGIERLREQHDVEWILTMDQDSSFDAQYVPMAFAALEKVENAAPVGMLCSGSQNGFGVPTLDSNLPVMEAFDPMQSGSLIRSGMLDDIGGFSADFIIDAVDSDFNARARRGGWVLLAADGADLTHALGESRPMRIGRKQVRYRGKPMMIYEHKPFRVYYMARNNLVLAKRNIRTQPQWVVRRLTWELQSHVLRIVYGPHRAQHLLAIVAGTWDGLTNRMGKISPSLLRRITPKKR